MWYRLNNAARLGVLLVLAGAAATWLAAQESDPPVKTYTVVRAADAIKIDGKFDEAAWKNAELGELGDLKDGKLVKQATTFRMMYDDEKLYVAIHAVDDHVFSSAEKHDDPVFNGDCVELFFITGADPHYYYEIDLSPAEVVWDALIVNTRGWDTVSGKDTLNKTPLKDYDCAGLEMKVVINGGKLNRAADGTEKAQSWDIELAIPIAQLPGGKNGGVQPGDAWRGNVYRIDRPPQGKVELQGYSPTLTPNFTRIGRFAYFKFK